MPAPRRQKQSGALGRLPSSRLPLGTPQPPSRSQTTSCATDRSTSTDSHNLTSLVNATEYLESEDTEMATSSQPALSMAETKLQRQNERIQLAEAALANPPQLERSRPQSRAKARGLKQSDDPLYSGRSRATSISDGGVAIETRVNSYRSEGSRPPRPYTSSAQDSASTTNVGAVAMERQDSVMDDVGFQTYTGRRSGRRGEVGAYEEKSEIKQTTVEATVDQREILAVFANPLPGLEFLAGQAGWRDGQVQFIQHPNGDVSAHMWSMKSYQWDNIGHFSNIRKKIEGQLAGDLLKGETTFQKLQQNSLAYFRTIAKQREAATTKADFGQAEIQQLLPEPGRDRILPSKKLSASTPAFSQVVASSQPDDEQASRNTTVGTRCAEPRYVEAEKIHSFYNVPQGSRVVEDQIRVPLSPRQVRGAEDPFLANGFVPTLTRLGPAYNGGTVAEPARLPASMGFPQPTDPRFTAYGLYSQTPLPAVPDLRMSCKPLPASRTSSSEEVPRSFGSTFMTHPNMPPIIPARVAGTGPQADRRHQSIASLDSLRGKPVTPLQAREAMRENLFKISDHAVERSLSRENLQHLSTSAVEHEPSRPAPRTVLHDPFQADSKIEHGEYASTSASRRTDSEDYEIATRMAPRPVLYRNAGMPLFWKDSQPMKIVPTPIETHLTDSVPDIINDSYPLPASRAHSNSYGFNSDPPTSSSMHSLAEGPFVSPERQLKDWWTGGSRFTRQEEIYQSMQGLSTPNDTESSIADTRRSNVTKSVALQNGDTLTRVLISVHDHLASYVTGPPDKRHDYWSRWSQAPEWCIDRGPNGNKSYYDDAGRLASRNGVGSRYSSMDGGVRFAGVAVPASLERRLRGSQY